MRFKKLVLILAAMFVAASLAACSSAGQSGGDQGSGNRASQGQGSQEQASQEQASQGQAQQEPEEEQAPGKMTEEARDTQVAPEAGSGGDEEQEGNKLQPAKNKMLRLTVPKMAEIDNDAIPTGRGTDTQLFRNFAGVRLKYTGFPWQDEANIYIAGHRQGFPGTNSHLAFYDLEDLRNGDEFFLTDAMGRRYTYEVYEKKIVEPTDLSVLKPIEGKNVVTLQTCTLPDYADRVIYRAELKDIQT